MIKILHLVLNLNYGGLEKFVIELSHSFSNEIDTTIVCLEEAGALANCANNLDIISLNEPPGLKFKSIFRIKEIVKNNNIQMIHTHNEAAHFYGSVAGILCGVPVVHTRHGRYLHNNRKMILLNILSSFLSSKIIGVSEDITKLIKHSEYIPQKKIMTILNGVDTDKFCPSKNEKKINSQQPNLSFCIGNIARLVEVKDHKNLINSCVKLIDSNKKFKLIVVGDGPLRIKLEKEVEKLNIQNYVKFMGSRNDISELLKGFDIFVLSSISEGISITLLEAMASGLPVVATNVGGNPEVVVDGVTGYLVPPENPDLLAEKLEILLGDSGLRFQLGQAGRERVLQKFSIKKTAQEYEKLYSDLVIK